MRHGGADTLAVQEYRATRGGVREGNVFLTSAQMEVGGELHVPAALLPAKRK